MRDDAVSYAGPSQGKIFAEPSLADALLVLSRGEPCRYTEGESPWSGGVEGA